VDQFVPGGKRPIRITPFAVTLARVARVVSGGAILAFLLVHACGYDWTVVPGGGCKDGRCPDDAYCLEFAADVTCIPFTCAERSCDCKETSAKCAGSCGTLPGGGVVVRCKE
jgi:hypothetical protein